MTSYTKTSGHHPPGFFEAEAAGLRWLADAGGTAIVPVHDVGPGRIVLERVATVPASRESARAFGQSLARMHDAGAPHFGSPPAGWDGSLYIGSLAMPSGTAPTWGRFYAENRVLPFLPMGVRAGFVTPDEAELVEAACEVVAAGTFDDEDPPARLHGDLWSGNVLWSRAGVVLIDPAAHGGHRETDLAMLALFGLPFLDEVLAAYDQGGGLRDGWRRRIPVHQLHPLAVHAASQGRGYGLALADAARATLALT